SPCSTSRGSWPISAARALRNHPDRDHVLRETATMHSDGNLDRTFTLSAADRQARLRFIGFTDEDARLLREIGPMVEAIAGEIVDAFYENISSYPVLLDVISRAGSTVERLKAKQRGYLLELFGGEYGESYFEHRLA